MFDHQPRLAFFNKKRRSKFGKTWKSKGHDIFKVKNKKLDKENYPKITGTPEHEKVNARKIK